MLFIYLCIYSWARIYPSNALLLPQSSAYPCPGWSAGGLSLSEVLLLSKLGSDILRLQISVPGSVIYSVDGRTMGESDTLCAGSEKPFFVLQELGN